MKHSCTYCKKVRAFPVALGIAFLFLNLTVLEVSAFGGLVETLAVLFAIVFAGISLHQPEDRMVADA